MMFLEVGISDELDAFFLSWIRVFMQKRRREEVPDSFHTFHRLAYQPLAPLDKWDGREFLVCTFNCFLKCDSKNSFRKRQQI